MKCEYCICNIDNCHECNVGRHEYKLPDDTCNYQSHHDKLLERLQSKIKTLEYRCDVLEESK